MKILEYIEFSQPRNKNLYARVCEAIERDDFRAADVKKLSTLLMASSTVYQLNLALSLRQLGTDGADAWCRRFPSSTFGL
jgi:hypothetical protein